MNVDFGTIAVVLSVLVPAATAIAQLATIRERVNRHDRSIENLGERLGRLEQSQARVDGELSRPVTVRDPAAPR